MNAKRATTTNMINRLIEPGENHQLEMLVEDGNTSPANLPATVRTSEADTDSDAAAALSKALVNRVYELYYEKNLHSLYAFLGEVETSDYPEPSIALVKEKLRKGIALLKTEADGRV